MALALARADASAASVGGDGGVSLALALLGFGDVAGDLRRTSFENAGNLRDHLLRHHHVEGDEDERQPEQLRREGRGVEGRESALMATLVGNRRTFVTAFLGNRCAFGSDRRVLSCVVAASAGADSCALAWLMNHVIDAQAPIK